MSTTPAVRRPAPLVAALLLCGCDDTEADISRLVEGALVQARLLKLSPVAPTADLLTQLFHDSLDVAS